MDEGETLCRTVCPTCGTVDVRPQDMLILKTFTHFEFLCPTCQATITKPLNLRILKALRTVGVPEEPSVIPEYTGDAPPLTIDDVIELHYELDDEGNIEHWMGG